jgi:hypothetical protein
MNPNDEVLAALAAADPMRRRPAVVPPTAVLASIIGSAPARQVRRPRLLRVAAISAPVVALAVIALVVGTALLEPPSAFATWTVEPSAVDPAFASAAMENCALRTVSQPSLSPELLANLEEQQRIFAQLPLVAIDQRGRAAIALFAQRRADGQATVLCMAIAPQSGIPPTVGSGGAGTGALEAPADGPLRLFMGVRKRSSAGTYTAYAGSVGPEVTRVIVKRSQGQAIVATVSNGYFLAWWPGEAFATGFVAENVAGEVVAEIGNNGMDFAMRWSDEGQDGASQTSRLG